LNTALFFLLSAITGFVEVGTVIYAMQQGFSVVQILLLVLAYQVGCFFPTNISIKKIWLIILGIITLVLSAVFCVIPSYMIFLAAVLTLSPCLQITRSLQKSKVSTAQKRLFRIIGFSLSPLLSPFTLLGVSAVTFIIALIQKSNFKNKITFPKLSSQYFVMFAHQMHYFSYAYIVLMIVGSLDNYNGFLTALFFVLSWITYTSAQYIFRGKKYYTYLIAGHLFLVLVISGIALTTSDPIKIVLWILTGFGGGTVFCIKEILKGKRMHDNHTLESSENYGHVLGVSCSIILFILFNSINASIYFAAICAATTAILARILYKNSNLEGK